MNLMNDPREFRVQAIAKQPKGEYAAESLRLAWGPKELANRNVEGLSVQCEASASLGEFTIIQTTFRFHA